MGKGSTDAPAPDPNIGKAALKQAETGEQWLSFAKDAFAVSQDRQKELDALTTRVTEQQLGLATDQADWSREDRQRYEDVYRPIEDKYIEEATNYASPERQAQAAAEARSDVQTAASGARAATERNNAAMGIDPRSGRAAGVQATSDMGIALAEAGAANNARTAVRDKGLALTADVANMGRGATSAAAAGAAGSVGASGTALSGAQATNAQAMAAPSIVSQGFSGAMQGYAGQASTLNQQYGIQSQNWATQQQMNAQSASGFGSFLGGIAGLFATSDEDLKEEKEPLEEGASLEALENMRVESWKYKPGVEDEGEHIGTYAQDFQRETGTGDGHRIALQDAIGVTMGAVKDLNAKVDRISSAIGLGDDVMPPISNVRRPPVNSTERRTAPMRDQEANREAA
jgi:hypothetical protein